MSCQCILSPDAADTLTHFPSALCEHVAAHLKRLAKNPTRHSRRAAFPYPRNCQIAHCPRFESDGERHEVTILFRYGQTETAIEVIGIGHTVSDASEKRLQPPPFEIRWQPASSSFTMKS